MSCRNDWIIVPKKYLSLIYIYRRSHRIYWSLCSYWRKSSIKYSKKSSLETSYKRQIYLQYWKWSRMDHWSFERHSIYIRTVMPCPSMWPKQFWSVQNDFLPKWITFGPDHFILVVTLLFWSWPNHYGQVQINLVRPKPFWTDQNCFGHIEGKGIKDAVYVLLSRIYLNFILILSKLYTCCE